MGTFEILLVSIGLAMDAFAVAICKGLSMQKMSWKKAIIIGLYFGVFQALMPLFGFLLGTTFDHFITSIDHWIVLILLSGIGLNMIKEAFSKEQENSNDKIDIKTMLILAIATSIDALAARYIICVPSSKYFVGNSINWNNSFYFIDNRSKNWKQIWRQI